MKTYKHSAYATLVLSIVSLFAIVAFNNYSIFIPCEEIRNHITNNIIIYDSIIFGVFTSSFVSLIVAITGYNIEKRRLIVNIWNNCRKLYRDFNLLMFDSIDDENLHEEEFLLMVTQSEFNQKIREWENYYSLAFVITNMELSFIFECGKKYNLVKALQEDIGRLSLLIDWFMKLYLNRKQQLIEVDVLKLISIINKQDGTKIIDTTQAHLDELKTLFKVVKVDIN